MSIVFALGATVDLQRSHVCGSLEAESLVWNIYYESNIRRSEYLASFCLGLQIER